MKENQQIFFSDLLHAHEAAHQWWGSMVTSAGYHDDWISNRWPITQRCCFWRSTKGRRRSIWFWKITGPNCLRKRPGRDVESAGPIVQGVRLGEAWQAIVYGKGTWIVHMLRKRLGDDAFSKMLANLRREFEDKTITTEQFRLFCAGFLPPKSA